MGWSAELDHPPRQASSSAASGQSGCPSQSRARGRQRPSVQASEPRGQGQLCSSVPSPQSSRPSQRRARGRQWPELQDIWPSPQPGVAQPGMGQAGRVRMTKVLEEPHSSADPGKTSPALPTTCSHWQRLRTCSSDTREGEPVIQPLPHMGKDTHPPRLSHRHSHPGCHKATRGAHSAHSRGTGPLPPHSQALAPRRGNRRSHKATGFPCMC